MSSAHDQLLKRLCGKEETVRDARELLNLAKTKTGPGSGHSLGAGAVGLPAICALLASQRLTNNDVVEQVAQQASCLNVKQFRVALNTVCSALASHLKRSKAQGSILSYKQLCRDHGLDDDTLYWLEEVDKELHKNVADANEEIEAETEDVMYVVFYWTCIGLNIRSVKRSTIMSEYEVTLADLQYLEELLDAHCFSIRESIGNFVGESRSSRAGGARASARPTPVTPRTGSPTKNDETPTRTRTTPSKSRHSPFKADPNSDSGLGIATPAKRKTSQLPPLPFPVPASLSPAHKRQKITGSPMRLMRVPVAKAGSTAASITSTPKSSSPIKTYGGSRTFLGSSTGTPATPSTIASSPFPVRHEEEANKEEGDSKTPRQEEKGKGKDIDGDTGNRPLTPIKERIVRSITTVEVVLRSPSRSAKKVQFPAEVDVPVTPTPNRVRGRVSRRLQESSPAAVTPSTIRSVRSTKASSVRTPMRTPTTRGRTIPAFPDEDEENGPPEPPCRHRIMPFADRQFYHYRDPRVVREWDACGWKPDTNEDAEAL